MDDLIKTQHFTKQYEKILKGINFHPEEAIDPFAGECDLKYYSPETKWTFYDLEPKNDFTIKNNSLLNPPDYIGKSVITNPPYLAKNKTKEFQEEFKKYNTDDLYKASILSIIGCKNGILIIPINFFTDEYSEDVRKKFLSQYKVEYVNVFNEPVFEDTTYNICSFYFEKGKTKDLWFYNVDEDRALGTNLKEEYGYRLGGSFYYYLKDIKPIFGRARKETDKYITNMFLTAIDTRDKAINLSYNKTPFFGKETDRVWATITCEKELSKEEQLDLIERFNCYLNSERRLYHNLILTNYRDFARKRIGFETVYKMLTQLYKNPDWYK